MHRNLDRRVEALVQVTDPVAREELDRVIRMSMSDECEAFVLQPDGTWIRRQGETHLQEALLRRVLGASKSRTE